MKVRIPGQNGGGQAAMLKKLQDMQAAQAALEEQVYDVQGGGGMVTVTIDGKRHINAVKINPAVVDPEDVETLEDIIVAAVNEAIEKVDNVAEEEMGKFTAGMNIPGLGL